MYFIFSFLHFSIFFIFSFFQLGMCARSLVFVNDMDALAKWSNNSNANVEKKE